MRQAVATGKGGKGKGKDARKRSAAALEKRLYRSVARRCERLLQNEEEPNTFVKAPRVENLTAREALALQSIPEEAEQIEGISGFLNDRTSVKGFETQKCTVRRRTPLRSSEASTQA